MLRRKVLVWYRSEMFWQCGNEHLPPELMGTTGPFSRPWQHHSLLALFTGIWGSNFILAEVALSEISPISFSVTRFATGAVTLFVVLCLQRRYWSPEVRLIPTVESKDVLRLVLVAFMGALMAPWLGIEGLARSTGARASLWLALGPVISVAVGAVMRSERIGRMGYVGVGLAGLGGLVLALDGLHGSGQYIEGDILLLIALLFAVMELHLIKPLAVKYGSVSMVSARTAIGVVIYAIVAAPSLVAQPWVSMGGWTWIAILAGGGIGIGLGQWIKVRALDSIGPTRVVLYGNLVPVAALLIAWAALSAVPSIYETAAAILILTGAICLEMLDKFQHPQPTTAEMAM